MFSIIPLRRAIIFRAVFFRRTCYGQRRGWLCPGSRQFGRRCERRRLCRRHERGGLNNLPVHRVHDLPVRFLYPYDFNANHDPGVSYDGNITAVGNSAATSATVIFFGATTNQTFTVTSTATGVSSTLKVTCRHAGM